ncbi:MAG: hypothetical protein KME49_11955 [Brasilonema octagenarum HA4186-MV1]|jgi:hypothetical protein|uniref:Uncharacterized protein n=2 Tax=Brasilonema TaxID=383614 RepID=A0A856MM59_9CYAN|nr:MULTISPECIES: hypothetical protein [Brasilonema]MBW4626187.1 hypothetical protein [Brasilonema octagenarum HA4186-MV1]NMF61406.1 hypothetical protein [Brasilonema octagenarum UFV-OR1]QDL11180.1 hypothetical protein DP114_27760 [Brasilonema sennae CENA114]QDL17525.1 hypothetical protein DP113_27690 [Brasilonema octagenarum UFV-E1]
MRIYWKPIICEVILEILLELAPGSFDIMATISEYLVESTWEASRTSIQLVLGMNSQAAFH